MSDENFEYDELDDEFEDDFPLIDALRKLPLFNNLFMHMQAMNIAITDEFIMDQERNLLQRYIEIERTPTQEALFVSALSQLWIFGVYELLRTWRQQVRELFAYANEDSAPDDKRARNQKNRTADRIKRIHPETNVNFDFYEEAMTRVKKEQKFSDLLKKSDEVVEPLFSTIEALRVTLAKHEVPKTKGMIAAAPGYGRIDMANGSIYWMVDYKDGLSEIISRRSIVMKLKKIGKTLSQKDTANDGIQVP